ncbi:hypothetical protein Glove_372g119 [Diversispora epigaea]|uniref:Uncharacterized protein n=1 Tax=Diversispora epigaea TaxID=1348612 RepID=A0A397H9L5_9GLOM|nr:hypothetical protein Glove_372g119 [Diversispora epigaea]
MTLTPAYSSELHYNPDGEREFWHLNLTFGSSRIASSAYQKWPTRNSHSIAQVHLSNLKLLTYLKFENRLRLFQPQGL